MNTSSTKLFLAIACWVFLISPGIQAQTFNWVTAYGNNTVPSDIYASLTRLDPQGNVYTAGWSFRPSNFGANFSVPANAMLLIKQNPLGEVQWIQQIKSYRQGSVVYINDMEIRNDGQIYLVGSWLDNFTLAPIPDTTITLPSNEPGSYVASYDHTGKLLYFEYAKNARFQRLEIAKNQDLYITGDFIDTLQLGGVLIEGDTSRNIFIAQLSPQNQVLELAQISSPGDLYPLEFRVSNTHELYLTSLFLDTVFVFQDTLIPRPFPQIYNHALMKFNLDNGLSWSKHFSVKNSSLATLNMGEFDVDTTGNIYLSYRYSGAGLQIDSSFFTGSKSHIDKYSTDGQFLWRRELGNYQDAVTISVSAPIYGGVICTGNYSVLNIGSDTSLVAQMPPNYRGKAYFATKFNSAGDFEWVTAPLGVTRNSLINNTSVDDKGNIAFIGSLSSGDFELNSTLSIFSNSVSSNSYFGGILQDTSIEAYQQNISGQVLADSVADCTNTAGRLGISNIPIIAQPGPYYGISDRNGQFNLGVEPGNYQVQQLTPQILGLELTPLCPVTPNYHEATLATGEDTTGLLFVNELTSCPFLSISITATRRRRCFPGNTLIILSNKGTQIAQNIELFVQYPDALIPTNINRTNQQINASTYLFSIPSLAPYSSDTIIIADTVSCADVQFLGQSTCISAWTNPGNESYPCYQPDPQWSGAELAVNGTCHLGDSVKFTIANIGTGDMNQASDYDIFLGGIRIYSGSLILAQGDSTEVIVSTAGTGSRVRFEGRQVSFHPDYLKIFSEVDICVGTSGGGFINEGNIPISYVGDKTIACDEIIGSYDPNEKIAFPKGKGSKHAIEPGTSLNYDLHFQNTGTDTAFKVVLIDTLPAELDLRTLIVQGASHPYSLQLSGKGRPILTCTFDPIALVDSTTNSLGSQGYFSFSISPYDSLPLETEIENFAEIYFDYNPPIKTQTTFHTISLDIPTNLQPDLVFLDPLAISIDPSFFQNDFLIYPNPGNGEFMLELKRPVTEDMKVKVWDVRGKRVAAFVVPKLTNRYQVSLPQLTPGLYMLDFGRFGYKKVFIQ